MFPGLFGEKQRELLLVSIVKRYFAFEKSSPEKLTISDSEASRFYLFSGQVLLEILVKAHFNEHSAKSRQRKMIKVFCFFFSDRE